MRRVSTIAVLAVLLLALVGLFLALRPGPPDSEGSEGSAEEQVEVVYGVDIQEGAMIPEELSVEEGESVVLSLLSDEPITFHLHGYDIEQEIEAEELTEVAFEADMTGRFEIEDHNTETALGELLVQPR